jgi:hypothetical protein
MADKAWKAFERRVAAFWGCLRNIGSGTLGRPDLLSASDSTHPRLFIEAKHHKRHAARTLWDKTKALAKKEGKTPILALGDCGRPGWLAVIHSDDLVEVARLIVEREDALLALAMSADATLPN